MDPADVVEEVNELLRLGVGDAFRLEHIKQAYIHEKTVWSSDKKYLEDLRAKYLVRITPEEDEAVEKIHCWKCGRKNPVGANYCMACGAALFEVGRDAPPPEPEEPAPAAPRAGRKKWVVIAAAIAAVAAAGAAGAYLLDYQQAPAVLPDSRCGPGLAFEEGACRVSSCGEGTFFDDESGACAVPPCGPGLAYDPAAGACVVPP